MGQFEQVLDAKGRAARGNRDEGIEREKAGPLSGQRDQPTGVVVEVNAVLAPIAAIGHQRELTPAEWVEGMGDLKGLASHRSDRVHLTVSRNGKQESFWGTLEGRLLKMLDGVAELTLELLNKATQAWVEIEYNRAVHRETGCSPVERFAEAPDVLRESPSSESLRDAFRLETKQKSASERRHDLAGGSAVRDSGTVPSLPRT